MINFTATVAVVSIYNYILGTVYIYRETERVGSMLGDKSSPKNTVNQPIDLYVHNSLYVYMYLDDKSSPKNIVQQALDFFLSIWVYMFHCWYTRNCSTYSMSLCLSRGHDLDEFKRIASAPSMDLLGSRRCMDLWGHWDPRTTDHRAPQQQK